MMWRRLAIAAVEAWLAVGTKISRSKDGKSVELENYGISPVALNNLKLQK